MTSTMGRAHMLLAASMIVAAGCLAQPRADSTASETGASGLGRVRRLSHREYNNVIRDLLGDKSRPADMFIEDAYTIGFDNGAVDLVVQYEQVGLYQAAAEAIAQRAVSSNLPLLLSGCDVSTAGESACKRAFISGFVNRAYRRPPTEAEVARLEAVYQAGAAAGGFALGIQTALEAVLESPAFLYRAELGDGKPSMNPDEFRLSSYELASELSFLLTGSIPDEALVAAAEEGRLATPDDMAREGARLLSLPAAKESLRTFINAWLATDRMALVTKDPQLYPSFNRKLALDMQRENDWFVDHVLWDSTGSLRELFTSNKSYVDDALASLYGIKSSTSAFAEADLDPSLRKGILTRAAYLSVHSAPDHSGPIARGVFFRQALLCTPLPPPPPDVLARFKATPPDPHQTTRQRFAQHSQDPFCKNCHKFIDGIGFGFEQFDAIGQYRTTERGMPVDSSGEILGTDIDGPFNGVSELSARLVESPSFEGCAVKQAFRYAMGRAEAEHEKDTIDALAMHFSVDRRFTDLFLAIAADRSFFYRTVQRPAP